MTTKKKSIVLTEDKSRAIRPELLDELLAGYKSPEDLVGEDGLLKQLVGALVNRAMQAEMTEHLGYESGGEAQGQSNRRNGKRTKRLRSDHGPLQVEVPRDREGTFEPLLVPKHSRESGGSMTRLSPCMREE